MLAILLVYVLLVYLFPSSMPILVNPKIPEGLIYFVSNGAVLSNHLMHSNDHSENSVGLGNRLDVTTALDYVP